VANLAFRVIDVETGARGLTPYFVFRLEITNGDPEARVEALLLRSQIQIQPARRAYSAPEKERLGEVFGTPERWGTTLRNTLWAIVDTNIPAFTGRTEIQLRIPCTYDLKIAAAKYFYALEDGQVSLLFLFSGTLFYQAENGRLQIEQIPWEKECTYALSVKVWRDLIEAHYPNSAWIDLHRDLFERLYRFRRENGLSDWDQTIERLLAQADAPYEREPA
jgi:hypothetical protein